MKSCGGGNKKFNFSKNEFQNSFSNFKIQTHFEGNSPEPGEERTVFLSDSATAIPHENVGHDLGGGTRLV